jgi:hypothetical protein
MLLLLPFLIDAPLMGEKNKFLFAPSLFFEHFFLPFHFAKETYAHIMATVFVQAHRTQIDAF